MWYEHLRRGTRSLRTQCPGTLLTHIAVGQLQVRPCTPGMLSHRHRLSL